MKTVSQSKKIYHGLHTVKGFAMMPDLWRFARWVADKLGQKVQVDGVEFAGGSSLVDTGVVTQGSVIAQPPPQYRFPRHSGIVKVAELADYARWLSLQMEQAKASADLGVKILPAKPGTLPVPQGAGLLLRRDLLAFIRAVGSRLGFTVEASDTIAHRDTGHGFIVRRKGPDIAHLVIESQVKQINGSICIERISTETPGNYVIKTVTTEAYENGTVVSSVEASGVIQTWEAGETPDACAALIEESDRDPEFDYGALESSSFVETLVSYADFYSDVITALLALSETPQLSPHTWLPDEWAAASDAVTGWKSVLVPTIGVVGSAGADNCTAGSLRWRAVNYGTVSIQVYWELQKTIDDSVVASGDFTLAPRDTSDWIGPPTAVPDIEESLSYKIIRISINGL